VAQIDESPKIFTHPVTPGHIRLTDAVIEAFGKNEHEEGVPDPVRCDGRAGAGPGR
jgi:hypothetical protein